MQLKTDTRLICAKDAVVPDWIQLFSEGQTTYDDLDPVLVDEKAFELIEAEFERRGNDMVVDYEHQTLDGKVAPAAGWIKELKYERDKGIMARVEWTQKAREYISAREYRYFSPVFYARKSDGRVCKINNVALTNAPRTNNLRPIVAKTLNEEQIKNMDITKVIELLGLAADATEADVLAKISELAAKGDTTAAGATAGDPNAAVADVINQAEAQLETAGAAVDDALTRLEDLKDEVLDAPVTAKALLDALSLKPGATVRSVVASVHALKQGADNGDIARRLARLETEKKADNAALCVAKALNCGKLTPNQKPWAVNYALTDPKGFNEFAAKAPQVVPVDRLPQYVTKAVSREDDFDETIGAMMGVTKDDYQKYGNK